MWYGLSAKMAKSVITLAVIDLGSAKGSSSKLPQEDLGQERLCYGAFGCAGAKMQMGTTVMETEQLMEDFILKQPERS